MKLSEPGAADGEMIVRHPHFLASSSSFLRFGLFALYGLPDGGLWLAELACEASI